MTTTTGSTLRIAGLAADDCGRDDERPPLVLLHGLTFDRSTWRGVITALHRIDPERRLVAVDLPGHGESPDQASYQLDTIVEQVHRVVEESGLEAPVLVGHSASGAFVTAYAARHASRGVVNVDSPLDVAPFSSLLRSLGDRLRGPDFQAVWQQVFYPSFHVELLPPAAQALVRSTCRPRQEVALGYWRQLLEQPADEVAADIEHALARLRGFALPYHYLAGSELDPDYRQWLGRQLPAATVQVWPRTSHFPHLANPDGFAQLLADTAGW